VGQLGRVVPKLVEVWKTTGKSVLEKKRVGVGWGERKRKAEQKSMNILIKNRD